MQINSDWLQRRFLKHFGFTNDINFSNFFVNNRQPVICGEPRGQNKSYVQLEGVLSKKVKKNSVQ
jgi:hypothetical protein